MAMQHDALNLHEMQAEMRTIHDRSRFNAMLRVHQVLVMEALKAKRWLMIGKDDLDKLESPDFARTIARVDDRMLRFFQTNRDAMGYDDLWPVITNPPLLNRHFRKPLEFDPNLAPTLENTVIESAKIACGQSYHIVKHESRHDSELMVENPPEILLDASRSVHKLLGDRLVHFVTPNGSAYTCEMFLFEDNESAQRWHHVMAKSSKHGIERQMRIRNESPEKESMHSDIVPDSEQSFRRRALSGYTNGGLFTIVGFRNGPLVSVCTAIERRGTKSKVNDLVEAVIDISRAQASSLGIDLETEASK